MLDNSESGSEGGIARYRVATDETGLRLDRWFKRRFPALAHGRLEKLLRTGQIRIDGGRVKAGQRLEAGQEIRVPPLPQPDAARDKPPPRTIAANDIKLVQRAVLHQDDSVIVLNKPPGLAVQGGTGTPRHLDGMLDALRFGRNERPRLVHRLDRDTSGVLVLARSVAAAAFLTGAFRSREARKIYWALVVGAPRPARGRIDAALAKLARAGDGGEAMAVVDPYDMEDARRAVTYYDSVERAGRRLTWLALMPMTGRTHQLRVHCALLGTPVFGDGKYGREAPMIDGLSQYPLLHLHARRLSLPHPDGGRLEVTAPLPPHMLATWKLFGFDPDHETDRFPTDV